MQILLFVHVDNLAVVIIVDVGASLVPLKSLRKSEQFSYINEI